MLLKVAVISDVVVERPDTVTVVVQVMRVSLCRYWDCSCITDIVGTAVYRRDNYKYRVGQNFSKSTSDYRV